MNLRYLCALVLAGAVLLGVASVSSAAPTGSFTTVVSGLDNPRDLAFSPNGNLDVAEAGSGGPNCAGGNCFGFTGGISVVDLGAGTAHRVVSGLASVAGEDGFGATGVDGISFLGNGTAYGIMTGASDAVPDGVFPADVTAGLKAQFGRLLQFNPSGHWKATADVGHTDWVFSTQNADLVPPGNFPDANPYGVLALGGVQWVVDAATNTIDRVSPNGSVDIVKFIPNVNSVADAVPTCIDSGRDGALYIGELTGAGSGPGASIVWRFDPQSGGLTQWATGLTSVTGCGFAPNGQFYATEFSAVNGFENASPGEGAVVLVPPHSTSPTVVADGLSFPGGFAAGADGALYASNWSIAPAYTGLGSVVRVNP